MVFYTCTLLDPLQISFFFLPLIVTAHNFLLFYYTCDAW